MISMMRRAALPGRGRMRQTGAGLPLTRLGCVSLGCLSLGLLSLTAGCGEGDDSGPGAVDPEDTPAVETPEGDPDDPSTSVPAFRFREPAEVASETRLTRLNHNQYQRTVQDLFGIREPLELTFAPDALNSFAFDTSNDFRVDARLGPQYRASAERLAERAVSDAAVFERIVPCDPALPECADQFLESFGERAFRRPLDSEQLAGFRELFTAAGGLLASGDAFRDGVQLSVEAMLQSPQFLYRTEQSTAPDAAGRMTLDDWEIASRLSYFLFDSMPDDELFALARAGQLRTPEQIQNATRRMLDNPRVLDKIVSFHEQAWQFGRFSRISPDPTTFPNVPQNFVPRVRRAAAKFIEDVVGSGGGLEELLTAPYAFADDGMAPLYGASAGAAEPGSLFRVDFPDGERQGLLMQVGFLASNSYSIRTDPIHRGLFVLRDVLCRQIPDPPPGASTTPLPPVDEPLETTREEISVLTGQLYCPNCHSQINPPGFAFEGFDAIGQIRTEENGVAVDTAAEMALDGALVRFEGAHELVQLLSQSPDAHRCYASRWLEFAQGRPLAEDDVPAWDVLSSRSLPVADIILAIVSSPQFTSLSSSVATSAGAPEATP